MSPRAPLPALRTSTGLPPLPPLPRYDSEPPPAPIVVAPLCEEPIVVAPTSGPPSQDSPSAVLARNGGDCWERSPAPRQLSDDRGPVCSERGPACDISGDALACRRTLLAGFKGEGLRGEGAAAGEKGVAPSGAMVRGGGRLPRRRRLGVLRCKSLFASEENIKGGREGERSRVSKSEALRQWGTREALSETRATKASKTKKYKENSSWSQPILHHAEHPS